ncbi:MAG: hypothetical protein MJY84_04510 [Bacteroidales bacterium]|nr:hypothetical protein [Bacteroidales bacterium]
MGTLKHVIGCLTAALLLASCQGMMKSDTGRMADLPSIVDLSCDPDKTSAVLTASVGDPAGISECGFYWFEAGISSKVVAQMDDRGLFSATIDFLNPGTEYVYCAYVSNGVNELRSMKKSFSTKRNDTPDEPEQPDNPDNPDTPDEPDEPDNPEDIINIPDTLFKAYIVWRFDADGDGEINLTEASSVRKIEIKNESIKEVTGIEHFKNMTKLSLCSPATDNTNPYTGKIKKIDLSQNTKLTELIIEHQSLTELDVSQNRLLTYFGVYSTPLRHIDISILKQVSLLGFGYCKLEEIDISNSPELTEVHLDNNVLKSVTLGNNPKLYYLDVSNNQLETIDISGCKALNILDCLNNPDLKTIYMAKGQVIGDLRKDDGVRIVYR